jgi:hypothetical protein
VCGKAATDETALRISIVFNINEAKPPPGLTSTNHNTGSMQAHGLSKEQRADF